MFFVLQQYYYKNVYATLSEHTDRQSAIKLRPINKETLKKMSGNGSFRNSAVSVWRESYIRESGGSLGHQKQTSADL